MAATGVTRGEDDLVEAALAPHDDPISPNQGLLNRWWQIHRPRPLGQQLFGFVSAFKTPSCLPLECFFMLA